MDDKTFRRWASKIEPDKSGCWIWTRATRGGYGSIWLNGRYTTVHKVVYEHFIGEVPAGKILEHTCEKKACCNPWCTEVTTQQENMIRYWQRRRAAGLQ
jgi:hypothetical protein